MPLTDATIYQWFGFFFLKISHYCDPIYVPIKIIQIIHVQW